MKTENSRQSNDWDNEKKDELFKYGYSGLVGWLQNLGHKNIHKWQKNSHSNRYLEIGIGQGYQVQDNKQSQMDFFGSDLSFHNLDVYKSINPGSLLVVADAINLPFAKDSFDTIVSIYMLEHIVDLDLCMVNIQKILRRNGEFLIALPSEGGLLYTIGRNLTTKRYMEKNFRVDYDTIIKESHVHTYAEIYKKLNLFFKIEKIKYLPFPFLPNFHLNAFVCIKAKKTV